MAVEQVAKPACSKRRETLVLRRCHSWSDLVPKLYLNFLHARTFGEVLWYVCRFVFIQADAEVAVADLGENLPQCGTKISAKWSEKAR
jgi:hypothetical protein